MKRFTKPKQEGGHIEVDPDGTVDDLYDKEGKSIVISSLVEWQWEIKPIVCASESNQSYLIDWKSFHEKGKIIAQELRKKLSLDFDLWYCIPLKIKAA